MDDLRMVRELLPHTPAPPPQVVARARERLDDLVSESIPTDRTRRGSIESTKLPVRRWKALGLTAAAAVLSLVAVSVLALIPDAPPERRHAGSGSESAPADMSARSMLLVAALREDKAAATTGRYWRVRSLTGHTMFRVGTGQNRYTLEEQTVTESWTAAAQGDASWWGTRNLGARPATPADVAAWRRDGSPRRWDLGGSDRGDGHRLVVSMAAGPGKLSRLEDNRFPAGGVEEKTLAEIQTLPTDPAALRAYLLAELDSIAKRHIDGTLPHDLDTWLFSSVSTLLATTPAPPKVRAAAYRVLAGLPDVRSLGEVRDPLDRTGIGVALSQRTASGSADVTLVIDRSSGQLLGRRLTGPKRTYTAILAAEWTDDRPTPPSVRPR